MTQRRFSLYTGYEYVDEEDVQGQKAQSWLDILLQSVCLSAKLSEKTSARRTGKHHMSSIPTTTLGTMLVAHSRPHT